MAANTKEKTDAHKAERDAMPAPAKKTYDAAYKSALANFSASQEPDKAHKAAMKAVGMKYKKQGKSWIEKRRCKLPIRKDEYVRDDRGRFAETPGVDAFVMREEDQNPAVVDAMEEAYREDPDYVDAIVAIGDGAGGDVLDGHHRLLGAKAAGVKPNAVYVTQEEYDFLQDEGYDDMEISAMAQLRAGNTEAAYNLNTQFAGADIVERADEAAELLDSTFEKRNRNRAEVIVKIAKLDVPRYQSFGWAYISKDQFGKTVFDSHGDTMPINELEIGVYDYMLDSRVGGEMHERTGLGKAASSKSTALEFDLPRQVSSVIESVVFTPEKIEKMGLPENFPQGWWIGQQHAPGPTWEKIAKGEYTMYSVHGDGIRRRLEGEDEPAGAIAKARAEIHKMESFSSLSPAARAVLQLEAAANATEAISKGKGQNRHGPSIHCPDIYDALRREGASKRKAARISNECASDPNCRCH